MPKPSPVNPLLSHILLIGEPLAQAIYDKQGVMLMPMGAMLENQAQLDALYQEGLYLESDLEAAPAELAAANASAASIAETSIVEIGLAELSLANRLDSLAKSDHAHIDSAKRLSTATITQLAMHQLKVGDTLQIKPLSDSSGTIQYFVRYIGGVDKKSLICSVPIIDEKVMFIKENTGFSVRMFSGKHVHTFNTMAEVVFSRPYPHMHLKYPREVYSTKLRNNQRITVSIIAAVTNKAAGEAVASKGATDKNSLTKTTARKTSGRIVNLSLGGIMLEASTTGGVAGDRVECSFKISMDGKNVKADSTADASEALFVLTGTIRNVVESKREDGSLFYQHGIQFGEIAFEQKIQLQSYIFQIITGEKIDDL